MKLSAMKLKELMTIPEVAKERIKQRLDGFLAGEHGVPHAILMITVTIDLDTKLAQAHTEVSANGVGQHCILTALERYTQAIEDGTLEEEG